MREHHDPYNFCKAARIRDEANRLLNQLLTERQAAEQRLTDAGKRDWIKSITGRSSLEQAIAQTREMIRNMDVLMDQMNHELAAATEESTAELMLIGAGAGGAGRGL